MTPEEKTKKRPAVIRDSRPLLPRTSSATVTQRNAYWKTARQARC
jgi:hypothetical protein